MTRTVGELGRSEWARALQARLWAIVGWGLGALALAAVIGWLSKWFSVPLLVEPTASLDTVAEVVPAVVIAIFVFAVGTLFVVAQVVPQTRGTRAVEVLRTRHLAWTIAPALALTPLSALLLGLQADRSWPLASALLLGAVAYLILSTGFLLSILGEATNPLQFAALLDRQQAAAVRQQVAAVCRMNVLKDPPPTMGWWKTFRYRRAERRRAGAVEDLYDVVRTLRGWARSSATAGDSRELQVALDGTLNLVFTYAPVKERKGVPWEYNHSAASWKTSPLRSEAKSGRKVQRVAAQPHRRTLQGEPWVFWFPPACPRDPNPEVPYDYASPPNEPDPADVQTVRKVLADVWVANEVGRSLVRAVEFATTSKTLLDRDRARLLLTLEKAARRFADAGDEKSAGVLVAYLVELGLGARRCPPSELDWHFEPLARLAVLNREFDRLFGVPMRIVGPDLVMGTAAAVLKVTEAIAAARVSGHYERQHGGHWPGEVVPVDEAVITIVERTVEDLRNTADVPDAFTVSEEDLYTTAPTTALELATGTHLEPRDHPVIRPTDEELLKLVQAVLGCTPQDWRDHKKKKWYQKAAEAGHPEAMYNLSRQLKKEGNDQQAQNWLNKAADAGHRDARFHLAVLQAG